MESYARLDRDFIPFSFSTYSALLHFAKAQGQTFVFLGCHATTKMRGAGMPVQDMSPMGHLRDGPLPPLDNARLARLAFEALTRFNILVKLASCLPVCHCSRSRITGLHVRNYLSLQECFLPENAKLRLF